MNTKKIIIVLVILIALGAIGYKIAGNKTAKTILSPEEAKAKAEVFINENLVQPGTKVEIKDVAEEGDLYKIVVNVGGSDFDSYLTKDGAKFFPQVFDMNKEEVKTDEAAVDDSQTVPAKSDKPKVELFVMSHCPYGTQIEKGILPVIEALGDKIDFTLKFCDYAMHGEKELQEELKQYCLQKEQTDKLVSYLKCFLEAGDSDSCVAKAGVDKNKLNVCVSAADKEYKVTEQFSDKSTWVRGKYPVFDVYKSDNDLYGVGGSPTLIINGQDVSSGRDSASLLAAVCSAFNTQPEACGESLSSTTPAPGFGSGSGNAGSNATCN